MVWLGLAWIGLTWLGWVWLGLAWLGWAGLSFATSPLTHLVKHVVLQEPNGLIILSWVGWLQGIAQNEGCMKQVTAIL